MIIKVSESLETINNCIEATKCVIAVFEKDLHFKGTHLPVKQRFFQIRRLSETRINICILRKVKVHMINNDMKEITYTEYIEIVRAIESKLKK